MAAAIVIQMNGRRHRYDIQAEFMRRNGRMLFSDELDAMVRQLDDSLFLQSPRFDQHLAEQTKAYRELPARRVRDPRTLGAPLEDLGEYLDRIVSRDGEAASTPRAKVVGIVAPHLDYERGAPCYAAAYHDLAGRTDATRFVILGTNHFGMSTAVVGTRKDFETPFGVVAHDADFMRRLDARCGVDLCSHEFDHVREHSIELQVILLKRLLGDRPFTIAAYLCPDPCGETGTRPAPRDGGEPVAERGSRSSESPDVDLRDFALALRDEIAADGVPTCIIAAADLSHVGRYFQDNRDLDADNLHALEASDRRALEQLVHDSPEAFRVCVADAENPTHICSVGCIYAAATALDGTATPRLLRYHQAVTREAENCVTCCAMEFAAKL